MHTDQTPSTSTAVTRLRKEHEHVHAQLAILSTNAARVLRAEDPIELDLMLEVLQDLLEYVDDIHGPREDAALGLIARRLDPPPTAIAELARQHQVLQEHGATLLDHLSRVAADVPVSRQQIERDLVAFTTEMHKHIGLEESAFFPLVERVLTASDWERIEALCARH